MMFHNRYAARVAAAVALGLSVAAMQGCVTRLDEGQEKMLENWDHKGLVVKEKNPVTAGVLGILPIAGYAYAGHPVLAVSTIPLYPFLGPLWMPFDAVAAANRRNFYATELQVQRDEAKDKKLNDRALEDKKITYEQHMKAERVIEEKYAGY
jgi:hypothetical protein